jgi:hypothetical protein
VRGSVSGRLRRRAGDATELPPNPVTPWALDAVTWSPLAAVLPQIVDWHETCVAMFDAFEAGLGYFWVLEDEVVAVPRPVAMVADGRVHCETGPAVAWEGGARLWFLQGMRVPQHVVESPEAITVDEVLGATNVEIRRLLLERMGYERYLAEGGGELVSDDGYGRLWHCPPLPGEHAALALVEVVNASREPDGSRKRYFLRVPPQVVTARAAVAWTFGFADPEQYRPLAES